MNEQNKHEHSTEPVVQDEAKDITSPTADEIKSAIEEDLQTLSENESAKDWAAELKAMEDKYLRLYAEFDNYKRRTNAERIELFKTANQEVLVSLLPVLDDFSRALKAMQTAIEVAPVKEGVELVNNKLTSILTAKGLKAMESVGKPFDSEFHEAITNIPAPTVDMKGKIVDEVEKGYFLNDKVIRFAKVVVGE
ncbi:MAG: nucleotide exchange factor GrpE [Bacteroidota bacterium]